MLVIRHIARYASRTGRTAPMLVVKNLGITARSYGSYRWQRDATALPPESESAWLHYQRRCRHWGPWGSLQPVRRTAKTHSEDAWSPKGPHTTHV